jgi:hypothetical protein
MSAEERKVEEEREIVGARLDYSSRHDAGSGCGYEGFSRYTEINSDDYIKIH